MATPKEKTDALVRSVSDAAVANLERLFSRARITIEGHKLTARCPYEWNTSGATWWLQRGDLPYAINSAYQWFPAQFYDGVSHGIRINPPNPVAHVDSPAVILGAAVWQVGARIPAVISQGVWNIIAEEIREDVAILATGTEESLSTISGRIQNRYDRVARINQLHDRVVKEVRERLNWPPLRALPPRPAGPSQWTERF